MPEPGLQLEQRHRVLGVVELGGDRRPGAVAGDRAADVLARDAGLAAQQRDQHPVDVVRAELRAAEAEQHVDQLAGLAVGELRVRGPGLLPRVDRVADERVDRLGERGRGLVGRHVEQTHPLGSSPGSVCCCQRIAPTRRRMISSVRSPENSHSSAIARTSSSGYHGVPVPPRLACNGRSSPVRFSPAHISFAHTSSAITRGSGPISARDRAGQRERAPRVEPALDPLPLLDVVEEPARRPDQMRLRARQQLPAGPAAHVGGVRRVRVLADEHPVHARDPRRRRAPASRTRGSAWSGCSCVDPAADLDQREVRLRSGSSATASRSETTASRSPATAPERRASPARLRASHSSRVGLRRERQRAEHAHVNQRSGELLDAGAPRRCAARAIADLDQQLGPLGEIVEQRAARGEHQLIERALQVRAPQLRRVPERVQMRLDPADRLLNGRVRRTRGRRTARILNPRISQCRSLIPHSW